MRKWGKLGGSGAASGDDLASAVCCALVLFVSVATLGLVVLTCLRSAAEGRGCKCFQADSPVVRHNGACGCCRAGVCWVALGFGARLGPGPAR